MSVNTRSSLCVWSLLHAIAIKNALPLQLSLCIMLNSKYIIKFQPKGNLSHTRLRRKLLKMEKFLFLWFGLISRGYCCEVVLELKNPVVKDVFCCSVKTCRLLESTCSNGQLSAWVPCKECCSSSAINNRRLLRRDIVIQWPQGSSGRGREWP